LLTKQLLFLEESMIHVRTVSYEYKTISSYFDNKLKENYYDNIKNIVIGKELDQKFKYSDAVIKFHRFLLLSFSDYCNGTFTDLYRDYLKIFDLEIEENKRNKLRYIFDANGLSVEEKIVSMVECCLAENNLGIAFFVFILIAILIFRHYKDYIIIPPYLFEHFNKITDAEVKGTFLLGLIERGIKHHQNDLKELIKQKYKESCDLIHSFGVENVWLFGSIQKEEYNDYSDIDLVVKLQDDIGERDAIHKLSEFNNQVFYRKSDIHIYEDFIEYNPKVCMEKII